jgi:beta-glucanase (GH16 family)
MPFCLASGQELGLVWSDEFDGSSVDNARWDFQTGTGTDYNLPAGWGNNELQYYRRENAGIEDGMLAIDVRRENFGSNAYTSARMRTLNKFDFLYGRVEARIKIPTGQGIWCAFWMLPTNNEYGGWAASGEIDIMEAINDATEVHGTIHYGGAWPNNQSNGNSYSQNNVRFSDDFHIYALEWRERSLSWFVDGQLYSTLTSWFSANGEFPAPFDKDFHLLLNVAVGGNWPGAPDGSTVFPQKMLVDWVRVYQDSSVTGIREKTGSLPATIQLEQNFPNPFNPDTMIRYSLSKPGFISLKVFDVRGKEVETLVNGYRGQGAYTSVFSRPDGSGIYFYSIESNQFVATKKMILLK